MGNSQENEPGLKAPAEQIAGYISQESLPQSIDTKLLRELKRLYYHGGRVELTTIILDALIIAVQNLGKSQLDEAFLRITSNLLHLLQQAEVLRRQQEFPSLKAFLIYDLYANAVGVLRGGAENETYQTLLTLTQQTLPPWEEEERPSSLDDIKSNLANIQETFNKLISISPKQSRTNLAH